LPCNQYACGIGVELDGADCVPSKEQASKNPAACSGEEREFS
jgi:hypothetical protein